MHGPGKSCGRRRQGAQWAEHLWVPVRLAEGTQTHAVGGRLDACFSLRNRSTAPEVVNRHAGDESIVGIFDTWQRLGHWGVHSAARIWGSYVDDALAYGDAFVLTRQERG